MPRLVRRTPLLERIKARLDPYDFLLWLSEELNDDTYDEWLNNSAIPIGLCLNILFILARGASRPGSMSRTDDVFGETKERTSTGWFAWMTTSVVYLLSLLCILNAVFTFLRKRRYRLFEQSLDVAPASASAHRVRVDDSPMSTSPLRYLQDLLSLSTHAFRAHSDAHREVWELSVWDPKPLNLKIFTLFSPGHVLLYSLLLPVAPLDPRPSVTVFTAIIFGVLFTGHLSLLQTSFMQRAQDLSLVHGEVMNEYDTKFVRPSLNRPVRDVGTQTLNSVLSPKRFISREVDTYTPTTVVKRAFSTNPNTHYAHLYNPDNAESELTVSRSKSGVFSALATPSGGPRSEDRAAAGVQADVAHNSSTLSDFTSPSKLLNDKVRERGHAIGGGSNTEYNNRTASPSKTSTSSSHLRSAQVNGDRRAASLHQRQSANSNELSRSVLAGRSRSSAYY